MVVSTPLASLMIIFVIFNVTFSFVMPSCTFTGQFFQPSVLPLQSSELKSTSNDNLNVLHTRLTNAILEEDYGEAAKVKKLIESAASEGGEGGEEEEGEGERGTWSGQ